ncbi:23S rRNA methyltransferase attenuation leader peptide, partial [Shigella flexneri]|nr:23S rRNA methyltransferase attenuation leader peptide [Shigella sonnei]EIS3015095.1 23S rRNA methyltransferase attenuation leader peptide [Shigella flexneri]HAK9699165.1 23S rRNA methyltransferase attenuation leader peptide [Escherichia coli]HBW9761357.1 23S rRNA methyltransferase attenuation leader peptide [Klebsiella pneumoniae]EFY5413734.1 23S rRNA methyltransferase attenuation leader peptide [Shigella sonnei]
STVLKQTKKSDYADK